MNLYCLTFKPLGSLSHIPDAQTIFGAVCNIILQTQGEESFRNYIDSFEDKPLFVHSSMYPHGYLPMIHQSLFSVDYINRKLLEEESGKQLDYLHTMKQLKKIRYISKKVFFEYILNNQFEKLKKDLLNHSLVVSEGCLQSNEEINNIFMEALVNTHVQKNIFYFDSKKDNDLYYNVDIYTNKNMVFDIYIKTDLDEESIKKIFKYSQYFGFGPKHSSGKNSFQLIDIEKLVYYHSFQKVLLSKSAFDPNFVLSDSHYKIVSKLHQTGKYYLDNKLTGRFHLFKEGSLMSVTSNKDYYGKILKIDKMGSNIYYYAIGFVM